MEMEKVTCQACGMEFNSEDELKQHNAEAHGVTGEKAEGDMVCPVCKASFSTQEALEDHAKEAHGQM